jgi:predicted TIM-barrel fold metal-dependent hydrolase
MNAINTIKQSDPKGHELNSSARFPTFKHVHCCSKENRRGFLSSLLGIGVYAGIEPWGVQGSNAIAAQADLLPPSLIDVHHHVFAPDYLRELQSAGLAEPPARNWSLAKSLEDMDAAGVTTALTSPTTPVASFGDSQTRQRVARMCNEYGAQLAADRPKRFGFFATLPMLDVDQSLAEIAYSMDTLKANGIAMLTSYDGKWLGDPLFDPVMQEINKRKLVVYTHPANPKCCSPLQSGVPGSVIEFATDTTRTITSLIFSGTAQKYKDIRFIFSHAGGTLPFLIERLTLLPKINSEFGKKINSQQVLELVKGFYYDTAQASHPGALLSLLNLVDVSQVVFGTDYPYRTSAEHVQGLAKYGFSKDDLLAINGKNIQKLLKI